VKNRWRALFFSALIGLAGVSWMSQRLGLSLFLNLQLVGMMAAAGVAFYGVVTATERKWPAAVALLCMAPLGQTILSLIGSLTFMISFLGPGGVLLFAGAAATIVISLIILFAPAPRPSEPIAKAEIRR
jgi:hypothetical protein